MVMMKTQGFFKIYAFPIQGLLGITFPQKIKHCNIQVENTLLFSSGKTGLEIKLKTPKLGVVKDSQG